MKGKVDILANFPIDTSLKTIAHSAFVWFLLTVCFQMCPQISCTRGCIVTMVAFVGLFSAVCFQINSQTAWIRAGIFTLVAFVWLFSLCVFKCLFKLLA